MEPRVPSIQFHFLISRIRSTTPCIDVERFAIRGKKATRALSKLRCAITLSSSTIQVAVALPWCRWSGAAQTAEITLHCELRLQASLNRGIVTLAITSIVPTS